MSNARSVLHPVEHRQHDEERNDRQILKQEDGKGSLPVRRGELVFLGQDRQHESGRGQGESESGDERHHVVLRESPAQGPGHLGSGGSTGALDCRRLLAGLGGCEDGS